MPTQHVNFHCCKSTQLTVQVGGEIHGPATTHEMYPIQAEGIITLSSPVFFVTAMCMSIVDACHAQIRSRADTARARAFKEVMIRRGGCLRMMQLSESSVGTARAGQTSDERFATRVIWVFCVQKEVTQLTGK